MNYSDNLKPNWTLNIQPSIYKTFREELIARLTDGINFSRMNTKYKQVTTRQIAIKCNMNPFLKRDSELELLIKTCEEKGSYSKFWWVIKSK